jgi:radical SAM superfamily enzyme YgiQ (UPF0313 family)
MRIMFVKMPLKGSGGGEAVPLGLGYMAALLERRGDVVKIIDYNVVMTDDYKAHFVKAVKDFDPDIIGLTCNTAERFGVMDLAKLSKTVSNAKVIVGGVHMTFDSEGMMKAEPAIDIAVKGEGEATITELVPRLENGLRLDGILGITYRDGEKIVQNGNRPFIEDISTLPFPSFHLFDMGAYTISIPTTHHKQYKVINVISSRGCPYNCNFCSTTQHWGMRIRFRTAENFVDELEMLIRKYGYNGFHIADDNFTMNRERVIRICQEIKKRGLDIAWHCSAHVNTIFDDMISEMASAGCKAISFGIESGSERMLKMMNKMASVEQIENALSLCRKYHINIKGNFVFGYPGENTDDIRKSFEMMEKYLEPEECVLFEHVHLHPNTKVFREVMATGYFGSDFSWSKRDVPAYRNLPTYFPQDDEERVTLIRTLRVKHIMKYLMRNPSYTMNLMKLKLWQRMLKKKVHASEQSLQHYQNISGYVNKHLSDPIYMKGALKMIMLEKLGRNHIKDKVFA